MKIDYEGAADEAWSNYCATMREMGREHEIMGLYEPMVEEPEPHAWPGEDESEEPPPDDDGEQEAA